jgi:hypothetical protein
MIGYIPRMMRVSLCCSSYSYLQAGHHAWKGENHALCVINDPTNCPPRMKREASRMMRALGHKITYIRAALAWKKGYEI